MSLTIKDYQVAVTRTINSEEEILLGIVEELGEFLGLIKKERYHGHDIDELTKKFEAGDLLWYTFALLIKQGYDVEQIAQLNINKLLKRYPNGFTVEDSINREK